jgi:enolase 1/2/3
VAIVRRFIGEEILDSRGNPTVAATCELRSGIHGHAGVPSGASRGMAEAMELRDDDPRRYKGLGCRKAVAGLSGPISIATSGKELTQRELDQLLIELDGTHDKSVLGANAVLAASLSFAIASANEAKTPLFDYFAQLLGSDPRSLPRPTISLFSGGKHAGGQIPIQDVLVTTISAQTVDDALAATFDIRRAATELVRDRYHDRGLVGDEGGLAPPFRTVREAFDLAVESIARAGLRPGVDAGLCVDVAASHFFDGANYRLGERRLPVQEMIETVLEWLAEYPIVSVEDPLAEEDWDGWTTLRGRWPKGVLLIGDDLLVTNPSRVQRAVSANAANSLLLKVNQIGTLSEALEALRIARSAGWMVTASARSGDTEDSWLADLAVGWCTDQLKVGSLTRSERLAKWNRLLAIERQTALPLIAWPRSRSVS